MNAPAPGTTRVEADASPEASAIRAAVRPRRWGSWYVAEHRIRSMRAYLGTLVATSIGNPLVYLFALGVGLATLVDRGGSGGAGAAFGDASYLVFVAPALIALAAVMVSAEEFGYSMMLGFKWNPIFYGMNAAPISGAQIVNGIVIAVIARMLPALGLYFVIMVLFGAVPLATGILVIPIALLTGLAIGIPIASYACRIEQDRGQLPLIERFVVTPLLLFSGTFFPLAQLPWFLQWLGWISPLWHGSQLGRVVSYGLAEPAWLSVVHVAYPVALIAVCWRMTQRAVTRRLDK